jgi:diguanylate cyclase (GGDEF)-like protein
MKTPSEHFISIQTKFIILIISSVLLVALVVGGVGVHSSMQVIDNDSRKIMNLTITDEANQLNTKLRTMRQSVEVASASAVDSLQNWQDLRNSLTRLSYLYSIEVIFNRMAENDPSIISYYYQLNPDLCGATDAGIHYTRHPYTQSFQPDPTIDLKAYPSGSPSTEWYYLPSENGKPYWLSPKFNRRLNKYVISYVVPVYKYSHLVGVVGMDLDFTEITRSLDLLKPYSHANAFLLDKNGRMAYHQNMRAGVYYPGVKLGLREVARRIRIQSGKDLLVSYELDGVKKKLTWRSLDNDMKLVLAAPAEEIDAIRNRLVIRCISATLLICIFFVCITISLVGHIIRPLRKLSYSASRIASGDLDIHLIPETNDEVGALTKSFEVTAASLKKYISDVQLLAYRDPLTGVKSKTAYVDEIHRIESLISNKSERFALVLCDLNHLKRINDSLGHEEGDRYITNSCFYICTVFLHSPVYRIGGDEFVIILLGTDYDYRRSLLESFEQGMERAQEHAKSPEEAISIAYGMAEFDPDDPDHYPNYQALFRDADQRMYQKKKAMNGLRSN